MNLLKKVAIGIGSALGLALALPVGAVSIVEFSSANVASVLAYADSLFTDLRFLIVLMVGLPLAFWVIRKVVSLVRAR